MNADNARLLLRPLGDDDAWTLHRITDDPTIVSSISFLSAPFTIEDARRLIAGGEGDVFLGAWHRETGELIGVVGTHLVGESEIEIGYWMATRFAGQGYATEAAKAAIERMSAAHPGRTIFAECRPENAASWRVLEKLGFRPTGADGARAGRKKLILSRS